MALTREFIRKLAKESDVELPKEFIDGIVTEHLNARDAYADEQVKTELAKQPSADNVNVKETEEYKALKKSFEDYKAGIDAEKTHSAKETAYRELLKAAGVSDKRISAVVKVTDIDGIELDKDGKIKDADKHTETVKTEWADFIETTTTKGANTANPPANGGGTKMPKAEIYKKDDKGRYVLSTEERQKALVENKIQ